MAERFYVCYYHDKRTYSSHSKAKSEASRVGKKEEKEYQVFYCPNTGGYHITSITQAEMDQRQAAHQGNGMHEHQNFKKYVSSVVRKNPLFSPKFEGVEPKRRTRSHRRRGS